MSTAARKPGIWFPTIRAGTGTDVFTERLAAGLESAGIRTAIDWLPLRAEYAPWTVRRPQPPDWATIAHVNSCLHPRFVPSYLKLVVTTHHCVHDPLTSMGKTTAQRIYHRLHLKPIERRMLARGDVLTAVSRFTAEANERVFGPLPISVISNGIDTRNTFIPPLKRDYSPPLRLLYVGSNARRKGIDLLPAIMRQLEGTATLTVVGTSELGEGLPRNIHVAGRLTSHQALVDAYANAHALLFPSRLEGFGLAAAEAMACGLPVIATRCSALPEVVEDGKTGFLCPMDDVSAFAGAARKLAQDGKLLRAMSEQARTRAVTKFSIEGMISAYIEAYARCHGQERRHAAM
ncbi:glycosyltransferase family 4 protein [Pseudoxanthomonas sp. GW2]|jgi:Glycosyltransferase|uniref:glycosyltransferase family 4 protein n=1 Tax=Pseudoxanthomonas sp. GW2 TaxID=1211114 RepID=UPI0018DB6797|nr:glycosyltransferase family 4 protein [Pseudoxanthomonas sp. GW2]